MTSEQAWLEMLDYVCPFFPIIPYYYGDCGTGLTPDEMQEIEREIHRKQNEVIFRTGIASAVSWEFAVSKHFGFGFGAIFNAYFSPKDGWQFLPLPNLNAAYSF